MSYDWNIVRWMRRLYPLSVIAKPRVLRACAAAHQTMVRRFSTITLFLFVMVALSPCLHTTARADLFTDPAPLWFTTRILDIRTNATSSGVPYPLSFVGEPPPGEELDLQQTQSSSDAYGHLKQPIYSDVLNALQHDLAITSDADSKPDPWARAESYPSGGLIHLVTLARELPPGSHPAPTSSTTFDDSDEVTLSLIDAHWLTLTGPDQRVKIGDDDKRAIHALGSRAERGSEHKALAHGGDVGGGKANNRSASARSMRQNTTLTLEGRYFFDWPWIDGEGTNIFFWIIGPPAFAILFVLGLATITGYIRHGG